MRWIIESIHSTAPIRHSACPPHQQQPLGCGRRQSPMQLLFLQRGSLRSTIRSESGDKDHIQNEQHEH